MPKKQFSKKKLPKRQRQDFMPAAPRFQAMPKTFKVKLTFRNSSEISLPTGVNKSYMYGLLEFGGQLPLYAQQLYQFYRFARIYRVDIETQANAIPGGTAYGFDFALGRMIWDECSSGTVSPDTVALTNGAVHSKAGLYGGKPITLRKSFDSEKELGNPIYGTGAWQTYAQSIAVSGTAYNPWAVVALAATPSTGSINLSLTTTVDYHVEFFSLDMSPGSTLNQYLRDINNDMNDEDSIEDLSVVKRGTNLALKSSKTPTIDGKMIRK